MVDVAVVSILFPTADRPHAGTFVAKFATDLTLNDHRVTVLTPQPYGRSRRVACEWSNKKVRVHIPGRVALPWIPGVSDRWRRRFNGWLFARKVEQCLWGLTKPDFAYVHFLEAACASHRMLQKHSIPFVIGLGESKFDDVTAVYGVEQIRACAQNALGVVSVSAENAAFAREVLNVQEKRIGVFPNRADAKFRAYLEKEEARGLLGLDKAAFLGVFVGHFDHRKGVRRVEEAVERTGLPVQMAYLGSGSRPPKGEKVVFAGPVEHTSVPLWLRSADFFVLPTLAEGSPNALLEALTMGLPTITSELPSIRELVTEQEAILVNPMNVNDIADAIECLYNDERTRLRLSQNAHARYGAVDSCGRAQEILDWARSLRGRNTRGRKR